MASIKTGVIGVGKLGDYHCNHLSKLPEADFVGVYDNDSARATEIADKYGCKAFDTAQALLDAVDAVGIIVPTTFHHEYTLMALEAGVPVFVEKPIAVTIQEAEAMVALADQKNLVLQTGHIERFNPAIRALDTDNLDPLFIESHRLAPFNPRGTDVAVILDLMIHDIDILLSLVKSEVKHIHANGVAVVSDALDIANARIEFENGCVANVTASRISQRKMRKMRLFQRDAYISVDFLQRLTEVFELVDPNHSGPVTMSLGEIEKGAHKRKIIYNQPNVPEQDAMQAEWVSFFEAIRENKTPIVSGKDGLRALKIATQITDIIGEQ